jgi:hypothetical protein
MPTYAAAWPRWCCHIEVEFERVMAEVFGV